MWPRCSTSALPAVRAATNDTCALCASTLLKRQLHTSRRLKASSPVSTVNDKAYAKTLLLPKTDFPLRGDAVNRERLFRKKTTESLYKWQRDQKDRPLFVLHDGPPYANGSVHMGHALNKILKDVINRYKLLQGYRIHYMPGFDCHGLPIEHKALKQLEADHRTMDPLEVRKIARKTAEKAIKVQMKEFKQFGIMTDWESVYRTYDRSYEVRQLRVFQTMLKKGLIYRQEKPVLWSPSSRTALAEAEIEYNEDHLSESAYVRFPIHTKGSKLAEVTSSNPSLSEKPLNLVIWTTTPWTLPANMFVAYGRNIEYCIARNGREYFIVAKDRVAALSQLIGADLKIEAIFTGEALQGSRYSPPYLTSAAQESGLPIVEADYVTADSGTGLVHSAPAHGMDDYATWKSQEAATGSSTVPMASYVDADGHYSSSLASEIVSPAVNHLVGLSILSAAPSAVLNDLKSRNLLLATAKIRHKYPYDWRTKQPVIVRSTPQWFANVENIKGEAVKALESVKFVPEQGRNRLQIFTQSRSEWCISRQRSWGVPIPMLFNRQSGEPVLDDVILNHIISVLAEKGIDHWWRGPVEDFLPDSLQSDSESYVKGMDTMDVWFDSGVSWTGIEEQLKPEGLDTRTPLTEVYLEGSDQHRGWFQSSLLTSIAVKGQAPFANVVTHGFVLDKNGVKMSKSIGNVISPLTVINGGEDKAKLPAYGADVLRFWAASSGYTRDVTCSMETISTSAETLRKIRNTLRFILGNLVGDSPKQEETPAGLSFVDHHVLHELSKLRSSVRTSYDDFLFNKGLASITQFCTSVLSSFYFEIIKDSLYADSKTSAKRAAIVYTLHQVLNVLAEAMAPITPHLTEDLWEHWPKPRGDESDSYFQAQRYEITIGEQNDEFVNIMQKMLVLRKEAMATIETARRGESSIGNSVQAKLYIESEDTPSTALKTFLLENESMLPLFFVVSQVSLGPPGDAPVFTSRQVDLGQDGKLQITCGPAQLNKCPRCWLHTRQEAEEVCARCQDVLGQ